MLPIRRASPSYYRDFLSSKDIPREQISPRDAKTRNQGTVDRKTLPARGRFLKAPELRIPYAPEWIPKTNVDSWIDECALRTPKVEPTRHETNGTGFPFKVRHRFLYWLVWILETTFADRARLQGVTFGDIDMSKWRYAFENDDVLRHCEVNFRHPHAKSTVYEGAEQIRHAAEHRRDIDVRDLEAGMTLPGLFGDSERQGEIDRVYSLVLKSLESNCGDAITEPLEKALTVNWGRNQLTGLYTSLQYLIEDSLFRYTQRTCPELLKERCWDEPEQGEMPEWEEAYRGKKATQDCFVDHDGKLLNNCLLSARDLRNFAAHRHYHCEAEIVAIVHGAIKCLITLGDYKAAIEAEILAEQWLTKTSKTEVIHRLAISSSGEDLPLEELVHARRREERRRTAIATIAATASRPEARSRVIQKLTPGDTEKQALQDLEVFDQKHTNYFGIPHKQSLPPMPDQITITYPDAWDQRRETISPSMHPKLKALPTPDTWILCSRTFEDDAAGDSWFGEDELESEITQVDEQLSEQSLEQKDDDGSPHPESPTNSFPSHSSSDSDTATDFWVDEGKSDSETTQAGEQLTKQNLEQNDSAGSPRPEPLTKSLPSHSYSDSETATTTLTGSNTSSISLSSISTALDEYYLNYKDYGDNEISAWYNLVGEEMPSKVSISIRREIRNEWRKPRPRPQTDDEETSMPTPTLNYETGPLYNADGW